MSQRMFDFIINPTSRDKKQKTEEEEKQNSPNSTIPDRTSNEVTFEKYQYSLLKGGPLSLRLFKLLPGTRQDDIAISLFESNLNNCKGSYEALSYVWGDDSKKTPIQINEQTLDIGVSLRSALLNLRLLDESRTLWVDAICINQDEIQERNQQVTIMGDIYRQAAKTVIWLGSQEEKQIASAFLMLEDLATEAELLAQDKTSTDDKDLEVLPALMLERTGVNTPMFNRYKDDYSILPIAASRWWFRAWTLQEILLASHASIMAERCVMDWDRFCFGVNYGFKLGLWPSLNLSVIFDPISIPYYSLRLLNRERRLQSNKLPTSQLLELLVRCRFREAANPRDKIYALLGLLSNPSIFHNGQSLSPPLGIIPDYASSTAAVYTYVARQLIAESDTLDLLGSCTLPGPEIEVPSWVPDWSLTDLTAIPLMQDALDQPRGTHATPGSVPLFRFINGCTTLILQAYEITSITALAAPINRIQFNAYDEIKKLLGGIDLDAQDIKILTSLRLLGRLLALLYEAFMSIVPHLGTYAEWEMFAQATPPTNPRSGPNSARSRSDSPGTISNLIRMTNSVGIATGSNAYVGKEQEEPEDPLAVYWQTLCTGTYATDRNAIAPGRGPKIATQQLFYLWRASLKPIRDLHRWRADRYLRPLGFIGFLRKTWKQYSEFARLIDGVYERRLVRGANGYLCLVPAAAEIGDKIVLAEGGRFPLVMRQDSATGYWRFIGEAYVQGIMEGQIWDKQKCIEFKIR